MDIFRVAPFGQYIANTLLSVVLNVLGRVISTRLVGYAFSRFRWPGRDIVFTPAMATLIVK